jgi:hypothetical protein
MKQKELKASEEAAKRAIHKSGLKKRSAEPQLKRGKPYRVEKPTFLIVCGGKNTEPSYFNQFRLSSATIRTMANAVDPMSLLNWTLSLSKKNEYEEVWCVFDKDDFLENDFNSTIALAKKSNVGAAYSNQAFEYWFLLHFKDHQGAAMHRNKYHEELNRLLKPFGCSYDGKGTKLVSPEFFELMEGTDLKTSEDRNRLAIRRAKKILEENDQQNPAKEESSTTVHLLVEKLLAFR